MNKVVDKSIDLSSISFGFLLAVLALLLQGDNGVINRIRASGKFKDLINLNKKAVLASGFLVVFALVYIALNLDEIRKHLEYVIIMRVADSFFLAVLIYQLLVVLFFLDIFYFIIKQDD